jgi:hypothetical protein
VFTKLGVVSRLELVRFDLDATGIPESLSGSVTAYRGASTCRRRLIPGPVVKPPRPGLWGVPRRGAVAEHRVERVGAAAGEGEGGLMVRLPSARFPWWEVRAAGRRWMLISAEMVQRYRRDEADWVPFGLGFSGHLLPAVGAAGRARARGLDLAVFEAAFSTRPPVMWGGR